MIDVLEITAKKGLAMQIVKGPDGTLYLTGSQPKLLGEKRIMTGDDRAYVEAEREGPVLARIGSSE